jgi:drug/metabolite transporter (DMT)-like permease
MLTVAVGLVSAFIFGAADFLGGLGSRRISPIRVTAIVGVTGFVVMLVLLPIVGGEWTQRTILLGVLSGICGAIAVTLLYASLAVGPMSILSPLAAVVSAIVPMTVGLLSGERLGLLGYVALGLALVAVVLVGFVPSGGAGRPTKRGARLRSASAGAVRPSLRGVLMAVGSGIFIGLFLVIMDQTPASSGIVPLVVNRGVNSIIMLTTVGVLALVAWRRQGVNTLTSGWRAGLPLAVGAGVLDAIANAGLLLGLRLGELSVISVLTALYPAGTIILAAIVLKERIAPVQYVGLALAITAGAMLALV